MKRIFLLLFSILFLCSISTAQNIWTTGSFGKKVIHDTTYIYGLDSIPPAAPSSLVVNYADFNQVTIDWTNSADSDLLRVRIYAGLSAGALALYDSVLVDDTSYIFTALVTTDETEDASFSVPTVENISASTATVRAYIHPENGDTTITYKLKYWKTGSAADSTTGIAYSTQIRKVHYFQVFSVDAFGNESASGSNIANTASTLPVVDSFYVSTDIEGLTGESEYKAIYTVIRGNKYFKSDTVTFNTVASPTEPLTLYTPSGLFVQQYGAKLRIRWEDFNGVNADSFSVESSANGSDWVWEATTTTEDYYDTLGTNITRYYRARTYNSTGAVYSSYSNTGSGKTALAVYWIKIGGSDGAAGTSPATAWATIGKANTTLTAGDAVIVLNGSYSDNINPTNSGTSSNPITYMVQNAGTVTLTNYINITAGQDYINLRGFNITGQYYMRLQSGATYIDVTGLTCTGSTFGYTLSVNIFGSCSYITIRDCSFRGVDAATTSTLYQDIIQIANNSHHILIDNCRLIGGTHTNINALNATYIIVRNSYFWSKYHHNFNCHSGNLILVDNNIFGRAGTGNIYYPYTGATDGRAGGNYYMYTSNTILRRNIFQYAGAGNYDGKALDGRSRIANSTDNNNYDNRFYHNVFYKMHDGLVLGMASDGTDGLPYLQYGNNVFKNNIFYKNAEGVPGVTNTNNHPVYYQMTTINTAPPYAFPYAPVGDKWTNNIIEASAGQHIRYYNSAGTSYYINASQGTPNVTSIANTTWTGNFSANPLFVNLDSSNYNANDNFNVQTSSPAIDAGAYLTTTANSGTGGTLVKVTDVKYFNSGWGIPTVFGDRIQIGAEIVRISSISNDTLTIDRAINWSLGANVSLPYSGSAPDIGAYEYTSPQAAGAPIVTNVGSSSVTYNSATISATVNTNVGGSTTVRGFYGTNKGALTDSAACAQSPITSTTTCTRALSGLAENTEYFYKFSATNSEGYTTSNIGSFTTLENSCSPPVGDRIASGYGCFEEGNEAFNVYGGNTAAISTDYAHLGTHSLKTTYVNNSNGSYTWLYELSGGGTLANGQALSNGASYTLKFWANVNTGTVYWRVWDGDSYTSYETVSSTTMTEFTITFTKAAGSDAYFECFGLGAGEITYIDDISIVAN